MRKVQTLLAATIGLTILSTSTFAQTPVTGYVPQSPNGLGPLDGNNYPLCLQSTANGTTFYGVSVNDPMAPYIWSMIKDARLGLLGTTGISFITGAPAGYVNLPPVTAGMGYGNLQQQVLAECGSQVYMHQVTE